MIVTPSSATAIMPLPSAPSFQHLLDGLQRNVVVQQRVFGTRLLAPDVMQSSQYPRVLVQQLGVLTGQLCGAFMHVPLEAQEQRDYFLPNGSDDQATTTSSAVDPAIPLSMVHVLLGLIQLAYVLKIDLHWAILQKMELNNRKYPVDLCKGKAGKYTAYSQVTGITKTEGQSTSVYRPTPEKAPRSRSENGSPTSVVDTAVSLELNDDNDESSHSIAELQLRIRQFALDRQWQQYHQPRNLVLALMGEFGELAELFQWRHEDALMQWDDEQEEDNEDETDVVMKDDTTASSETTTTTPTKTVTTSTTMAPLCRDKVQQEIADVAIYLLRLADVCHIALDQCAWQAIVAQPPVE